MNSEFSTEQTSTDSDCKLCGLQTNEVQLRNFLSMYNASYQRMYLFAKSLLPTGSDAEDVIQEVSIVLWKKFSMFREKDDFLAWAFGMIRIEVLRWKRKGALRDRVFSEDFYNTVARSLEKKHTTEIDNRYKFLLECHEKLPVRMRELITQRYFHNIGASEIAKRLQVSIDVIYQRLSRIRARLRECVEKKISRET